MIDRIVCEVALTNQNGRKTQHFNQAVVVMGKIASDDKEAEKQTFKEKRTIAWSQYFFGEETESDAKLDSLNRKIKDIVKKAAQTFLSDFYYWDIS